MQRPITARDIANADIEQIQSWLQTGVTTSAELVLLYLERIARYDRSGPMVNSVAEVNPDAYHIAQALDQERALRGPRGPLHGIPVLIKDNIATGDKMHTTAGSLAMQDVYAPEDATVVERLRQAGAIILGKANLTEWANFMTENMPNGYSSRGGQVQNPYGPGTIDPGGSSAGSGAAIAASLATFAIGTETSGSILSPSSQNSLVGIKPTIGLISRFGIVPISHSQDTAGPMARTVKDAALALSALVGPDPRDPVTGQSEGRYPLNYADHLNAHALSGTRIGVPRQGYLEHLGDGLKALMDTAIDELRQLGAHVVDPAELPEDSQSHDLAVLVYEFKSDLNAYFRWLGDRSPVRSLSDVIAYNEAHSETCLKHGQTILVESDKTSGTLTEPEYLSARARDLRLSATDGLDQVMKEHRLDALVFPANYGAGIAAKAGYPSVTVPAGYGPDGTPLGLTFTAGAFQEETLIQLAYAYEQGSQHRRAPDLQDE